MWIDVVIVALLLGACAFLKRADWHTRFVTRIRTAGNAGVKQPTMRLRMSGQTSAPTGAAARPRGKQNSRALRRRR